MASIVTMAADSMSGAADAMKDASDEVMAAANVVAEQAMNNFQDGTGKAMRRIHASGS